MITPHDLRNDSGRLMRELEAGRSFVVSHNGVPVGELRPLRRAGFVPLSAVMAAFADAPPVNFSRLRRDLDDAVDQDVPDRV